MIHSKLTHLLAVIPSFLTVDHSTTLSDSSLNKKRKISAINEWASASAIPSNVPASRAPSKVTATTSSCPRSIILSLTNGSSCSSAPSVLTNNITIVSHRVLLAKVKAEMAHDEIEIYSDGGLSNTNVIKGKEREATIRSPLKGKNRVTSDVSLLCCYIIKT
jgi:hypothetical protein